MPIIAAVAGAVLTGPFSWLAWGNGLEYIDARPRRRSTRRRDAARRTAAVEAQRLAPLRSVTDPREDAVDPVTDVLRGQLDPAERADLLGMLQRVAAVHGGPTEAQERLVARVERRARQDH